MSSSSSLGEQVYEGTAQVGRALSMFGSIFVTVIAIPILILGINLERKKIQEEKVSAQVQNIKGNECTRQQDNNYSCMLTLKYDYGGKSYTEQMQYSGSNNIVVGEYIEVYIENKDPTTPYQSASITNRVGMIMIILAIAIPILSWSWYFIVNKYKSMAAVSGVADMSSMITSNNRWIP
jgi:hypothetical protein